MSEPTVCATCYHMYMPDARAPWYLWLCKRAPAEPQMNFVTGIMQPPWAQCRHVNDGACKDWFAGPNRLHPRTGIEETEKVMGGEASEQ